MHGLKEFFDMLPHEEISRLIIMQVARAYAADFVPHSGLAKGGLRMKKNIQYQSAVRILTDIVVAIGDKMVQEKDFDPVAVEQGKSPVAQGLRLDVLTAFLGLVMEKRMKGLLVEEIVQQIATVAEKMGTPVPREILMQRDWGDVEVQ